jgi:hypothetical protein
MMPAARFQKLAKLRSFALSAYRSHEGFSTMLCMNGKALMEERTGAAKAIVPRKKKEI